MKDLRRDRTTSIDTPLTSLRAKDVVLTADAKTDLARLEASRSKATYPSDPIDPESEARLCRALHERGGRAAASLLAGERLGDVPRKARQWA